MEDRILFSKRRALARKAQMWCIVNNIPSNPFNIVTALCSLGVIANESAILTTVAVDNEGSVDKNIGQTPWDMGKM